MSEKWRLGGEPTLRVGNKLLPAFKVGFPPSLFLSDMATLCYMVSIVPHSEPQLAQVTPIWVQEVSFWKLFRCGGGEGVKLVVYCGTLVDGSEPLIHTSHHLLHAKEWPWMRSFKKSKD